MRRNTFDIPYIKLQFIAEILENTAMPSNKVSALRGGLGEMLLQQHCIRDRNCEVCIFKKPCLFRHTFYTDMEKKPAYVTGKESVGYLIECDDVREFFEKGSKLQFNLLLFGDSIAYFNLYFQAFYQLGMYGVGKNKSVFQIAEVRSMEGNRIIYRDRADMGEYKVFFLKDYIESRKKELRIGQEPCAMVFTSPFSMKYQKEYMKEFYGEPLVKGAARRVQMLNYYMGQETELPEFSQYPRIIHQKIKQESIKRYSSTHGSTMILRGISGYAILQDITEECLNYLIAGEVLHIGRNTSFGFGKYHLRVVK